MPQTTLIIGDLAAIEADLAGRIFAARGAGDPLRPATVLVGSTLLKPYLRRMLAQRGVALLNVRFVRASELAEELVPGLRGRPRLSRWAERMLVREVAEGARGYFERIKGRDGFVRALRRSFRELEAGGYDSAGFARAVGVAAQALPQSRAKLDELSRLFGEYQRRVGGDGDLARAFVTPADVLRSAYASLFEGPLYIYGLWSLPELQLRLVRRIAERHDVFVFLPQAGLVADEAHAELRASLAWSDGKAHVAVPFDVLGDRRGPARIAQALFRDGSRAEGATGIGLVSAPDTVREVWEAARACLQWAREGVRFHEMAVIYRSQDTYRALVDEVFREAGIDTYLHEGRLLSEHPLGRRVLALLALAADPAMPRAKVMEFLTETELPYDTRRDLRNPSASEWETFTREAGIINDAAQWDARLARLAEEKRDRSREEGQEWQAAVAADVDGFRGFLAQFAGALAAHSQEATWGEHLAYLRALTGAYADGVAPIIDALDDLRVLEAVRERVPFEAFRRAVEDDLKSRDASRVLGEPVREFGRRGVAVIDATSARHLRFRAVYLLGVAERSWPPPPRPDPLLLERERHELDGAGEGRLPLRTEPDEDELTFWLAAQSASEQLRISYARADAGGSGKHLPSYFFRAAADALEGRRLRIHELDGRPYVRRFNAGRLAADALGEALTPAEYDRTLVHEFAVRGGSAALVRSLGPGFERAHRARQARWSRALTPYDGCMSDAAAVAAAGGGSPFARGEVVSPTRLETYATCPYRYFMKQVLHVQPLEEPETIERIDDLERGSLIHSILERFMREVCPDDPPRPDARERHVARLLALAHEEEALREERGVTGKPLIWQMDHRLIHEDLVRWYDREAAAMDSLLPRAFEVGFGPQWYPAEHGEDPLSSTEPLALLRDGREVRVQGRIDRVDWDEDRTAFRVVDYKTGKYDPKVTLQGGRKLQLPLYTLAASRLLGIPVVQGAARYDFVSARGGFKRAGLAGADVEAETPALAQVLTTVARGVDGGFFAPNPGEGAQDCRYCDYKDVCDARIEQVMKRKRDDPRGAAFMAMSEIP